MTEFLMGFSMGIIAGQALLIAGIRVLLKRG
jgi:hypothetical protein